MNTDKHRSGKDPDIEKRVFAAIATHMGIDPKRVKREARFSEDLKADSLDAVEVVLGIEEEFHILISDEEAEQILTVGDLVKYVEEQGTQRGNGQ